MYLVHMALYNARDTIFAKIFHSLPLADLLLVVSLAKFTSTRGLAYSKKASGTSLSSPEKYARD